MAKEKVILSKFTLARLQNSIETINRRISRLAQAFGKNSFTFKNEVAFLQKGALQKFTGQSSSGDFKVDYKKIKNFIQSGADLSEVNEILTKMAGVRIYENGEMVRTGSKVPTVGELRKQAEEKKKEMGVSSMDTDEFIESLNRFSSEFQSAYNNTIRDVGAERMEEDPIVGQLWMENRQGAGRLTYSQMTNIMNRMYELRAETVAEEGWAEINDDIPF